MKTSKTLVKVLVWAVAVVAAVLLTLPLWIGPVGKCVANSVAPGIVGTGFHLGEFALNPYFGSVHVGDMQLANPEGFDEKNAVDLSKFDADIKVMSLVAGNKYHVESVVLDGIVIYTDSTASNFRKIMDNLSGGSKAEGAEPKKAAEPKKGEEKSEKGYQIDHIEVDNVTIKLGMIPLKVPIKITIDGIGADSENGATLQEVVMIVYSKLITAAGAAGGAIGDLGKGTGDLLKNVGKGLQQGSGKGLKEAGKNIKDLKKLFK